MSSTLEHLASYVPPLVLRRIASQAADGAAALDRFDGVILLADISGFSRLAEELAGRGAVGAEQLSAVLNETFGRLIEIIHRCGGEVVDFAGDATIALFTPTRTDTANPLQPAAACAALCALELQREISRQTESGGPAFSLTVSIAAGSLWFADLQGAERRRSFLLGGEPLSQVTAAEEHAAPGDILLAPSAAGLLAEQARVRPFGADHVLLEGLIESPSPEPVSAPELPASAGEALRDYASLAVLAAIDSGHAHWLAELRRVTVWFLSVPVSALDPADVLAGLQTILLHASDAVERFGGAINEFMIDDKGITLLAAWGLPSRTYEDDALRALSAADAAHAALVGAGVDAYIGVATGRAFCGDRGNQRRREYALIGNTINLAARLAQAASPDVICDDASRRAAASDGRSAGLRFQALPALSLKERSEPVAVYSVSRSDASPQTRAAAALLGRRNERSALRGHLDALAARASDRARLVLVEGEPGIGKSRLLSDLIDEARARGIPFLSGEASAIEQATPYHAWRGVLANLLAVTPRHPPGEALRASVLERLTAVDPSLGEQAPLLNALLPTDFPETSLTAQMRGEARAASLHRLLCRMLSHASAAARDAPPLLIVLEDAHWFDSASWSLLRMIVQDLPDLLCVASLRPLADPQPEAYLSLRATAAQLRPEQLSREDTEGLLRARFGVSRVADEVVEFVHRRAAGNPFFCEELAAALRDARHVVMARGACQFASEVGQLESMLPDSVQGTVAARVDLLPSATQLALKVASVVGPSFGQRLLREIYPLEIDEPTLAEHLESLARVDLLRRSEGSDDYAFRHAITQQVAYEQLLFTQRHELHREAAEWHEREYAGQLAPYFPLLAHHWEKANDPTRALFYMDAAATQALRGDANREAVRWLEAAQAAARAVGNETDSLRKIARMQELGEAYYRLGRLAESDRHSRDALQHLEAPVPSSTRALALQSVACVLDQLGRRVGLRRTGVAEGAERERARLSHLAHHRVSVIGVINSDTGASLYGTLRSLQAAERLGPTPERATSYSMICGAAALIPVHSLARYYGRRAMRTLERIGSKDTLDHAAVLSRIGFHASGAADWATAHAVLVKARDLSERFGDWTEWGIAVQMLNRWAALRSRYDDLEQWSEELLESAQSRGALVEQAWAYNNLAEAELLTRGDSERVRSCLDRSHAIGAETANVTADFISRALLAQLEMRLGRWHEAYGSAHAALEEIRSHQQTTYGALIAYQATADVLLGCWESKLGDVEASRSDAQHACRALNRLAGVFPVAVPGALRSQAHLDWLAGRERSARRRWRSALRHAERLDMTHDVGWTLFELGRHSDTPQGRQELEAAAAIFEQLGAQRDLERARQSLSQAGPRNG